MSLGPHRKHTRREDPCPICQKVGGCLTFADGMTLCLRVEGDSQTATGWHVHKPANDDWRSRTFPLPPRPTPTPQREADPALCNRVYQFALDYFKLTDDELAQLRRDRHLTDEQIAHHGPFARIDPARLDSFASDAVARFGEGIIGAVPGFYRRNGSPAFAADAGDDGLLLPIRDIDGRIIRLRVRPNRPKKKYAWISSGAQPGGVGSGAPIGVYVPSRAGWDWTRVGIAEGEFKAITVAERFGIPVICVPGVNVIAGVRDLLLVVEAEKAIVFYDADAATNKDVATAEQRLAADLFGAGLTVFRAGWSLADAKGIDDLLNLGGVPLLEPFTLADGETSADAGGAGLCTDRPLTAQLNAALQQVEATEKQVKALAEENARQQRDLADLRLLQSQTMAAFRSKTLGSERATGVALAFELMNQKQADPNRTEFVVPMDRLADQTGYSAHSVSEHVKSKLGQVVDQRSGEIVHLFKRDVRRVPTLTPHSRRRPYSCPRWIRRGGSTSSPTPCPTRGPRRTDTAGNASGNAQTTPPRRS